MGEAKLINEIRSYLASNSDPKIAEKYRKYFVEGYDPYGVDASVTVRKAEELIKGGISLDEAMSLALELVSSNKYEEGHLAISLIKRLRKQYTAQTFEQIAGWFQKGIRNWAHVDGLSGDVVSSFLLDGIVGLKEIAAWETSEYKYQRRTVPVSLIKTVGRTFTSNQVIDTVEPLMLDSEKVVQQGLGWLLREIWKKDPGPVEALLQKYRTTGPRVIFQYATEKMTPQKKEEFRRKVKA